MASQCLHRSLLGLGVASITLAAACESAAAQDVSLNYENLSSLEEPLATAALAQADAPATPWQLQLVDSIGPEAAVVYWILGWNHDDGLQAPVDQSELPAECSTEPNRGSAPTRSLSTTSCASALADHFRVHEGVGGACVSALNKDGGWKGDCKFWVPRTPPDIPELTAGEVFQFMNMAMGHPPVTRGD